MNKYIHRVWQTIDDNITSIIPLYNIIKIMDSEQIDVIGNLLVKFICNEIIKTSIFNTKFIISKNDMLKGFTIMKQTMIDLIKCCDNYKNYVKIYFDNHNNLYKAISYDNVIKKLMSYMNELSYNNFIIIISCLLCEITLDDELFKATIKLLITIIKHYENKLLDFTDKLQYNIKICIKILCLHNININYNLFAQQLIKINNEIKCIDNMDWLNNILLKYIKDIFDFLPIVNNNKYDNINIFVAAVGLWSYSIKRPLNKIPSQFINLCNKFENHYKFYYLFRKLSWDLSYGNAEIELKFNLNCVRNIICTTYQMMILLLFNDKNVYTFKEILELTGCTKNDIEDHLLTLCHQNVCIIIKEPNKEQNKELLLSSDTFQINSKYNKIDNPYFVPFYKIIKPTTNYEKKNIESKLACLSMSVQKIKYNDMISYALDKFSVKSKDIVVECINNLVSQEYIEICTENDISYVCYIP
jgi:hypothetical protein